MTLSLTHCFLYVDDQDKALAFYRDLVGLQVHTDADLEQMRWLTLNAPGQPDVELTLLTPQMPWASPDDVRMLQQLMAKGILPGVIFLTDDVDALFERLVAGGAQPQQEPIDQPYGVRDCAFRDPAGNPVRFSQTLT